MWSVCFQGHLSCKYHTKLIYSALWTTTLPFSDIFLLNTCWAQILLMIHMWCKTWNVHERYKMIICFTKWLCIHKNTLWVHAMLCCGVLRYVSRPDSDSADKIIHALLKQKHTTFLLIHPSFKLKAFIYAMCNDCYI